MQAKLWGGAAACVAMAVVSGVAEWRRTRRADLDRVGFMPWPALQMASFLGALILASLALNG